MVIQILHIIYCLTAIYILQGLMARVYEASLVLFLLGILVLGLFYVASALISGDEKSKQTLLGRVLNVLC